ncbi:MAG: DPP IV N-terminal domain-containing protein, partial [Pseudomonadota bacterium]
MAKPKSSLELEFRKILKSTRLGFWVLNGIFIPLACVHAAAQTPSTPDDDSMRVRYERAKRLLPINGVYDLADGEKAIEPHWINGSDDFWYVRDKASERRFVRVNGTTGDTGPAFNHQSIARALSKASGEKYSEGTLPFDEFEYTADGSAIQFVLKDRFGFKRLKWQCGLKSSVCREIDRPSQPLVSEPSPNERWYAFTKKHNLFVYDTQSGEQRALTMDGIEGDAYASYSGLTVPPLPKTTPPAVYFSPDSKRLLTYKLDYKDVPLLHLQKMPIGKRPKLYSYPFAMPGDPVAKAKWVIFDLETGERTDIDMPPMPIRPNEASLEPQWSEDGKTTFFVSEEAGYRRALIHKIDADTGKTSVVHEETSKTSNYRFPTLEVIENGARALWTSERDGWLHLYLLDTNKKGSARQLTKGKWIVRELIHVDVDRNWIYFTASGREDNRDPYYRHLYRIRFDGSGLELLTPEDADHDIYFAPSGDVFIDTYSRADQAPVAVLRKASGELIAKVREANIDRLIAAGWRYPERFQVKARDGKTDLYGVIYRPSDFDPDKKYPVIDIVYPGPQARVVPKPFIVSNTAIAQATAELGFIVVKIDGMGTPDRSKAFREVSYGKLLVESGGIEDHVIGLKELGERFP